MKQFFKIFSKWVHKKICPKCRSLLMQRGYYIRGWNDLCDQATGDFGYRCYDCGYIEWNKTCGEYKKELPHWCHAYCSDSN